MKVKGLLKMDIEVDVYDDVCEELAIAYCGAMEITKEGMEQPFAEVLEYDCELTNNNEVCIVNIDDDEHKWQRKLWLAKQLFYSLAGYCAADDFDKWFIIID